MTEGLVGLVGEREEALNLAEATTHDRYLYRPELSEQAYHAFLGVPIIHNRQILGVFVVQQLEPRRFDEAEEAFLFTMSMQLSSVIANAEVRGLTAGLIGLKSREGSASYSGIASAPGVAIGQGVAVYPRAD
jgi:phosphotransferase system enzyme I (PtsP)